MNSNQLYSIGQEGLNHQGSIFNQLLLHYSSSENEIIHPQEKLFEIQEWADEQQEVKNYHKSSGEWVWADNDQFDNACENELDESKTDALTSDNFELKRVKSLRMEQQDKITTFLKKQSVLSFENDPIQEEREAPERYLRSPQKRSTLAIKSQSLSPRKCKSKKIDKFKQFKLT